MNALPALWLGAGLCFATAYGWAGSAAFSRAAFLIGWPSLGARLAPDDAVRGVGEYLAKDYAAADKSLQRAGRGATYNRGLSLAATGNYPLSRDYFLAVLFVSPSDSEARENLTRVEAMYPAHQGAANNAGRIKAESFATEDGRVQDGVRRLAKPLDRGGRVADMDWIAGLEDDPGRFLRLRLAEEHTRRIGLGLTPPEEGDPW